MNRKKAYSLEDNLTHEVIDIDFAIDNDNNQLTFWRSSQFSKEPKIILIDDMRK